MPIPDPYAIAARYSRYLRVTDVTDALQLVTQDAGLGLQLVVIGHMLVMAAAACAEVPASGSDPFGGGWMIRVKVADAAQVDGLLDAQAYERLTAEA